MSRFHKPRFSSAIVLILLYINSSFATPIANARRPRFSIVAADAPVHIIPIAEFEPHIKLDGGGGTTTFEDNGETLVTNFDTTPGPSVQKRRLDLITHASAPVHVIPAGELGPDVNLDGGGGTATFEDNGETLVTNFDNTPGHSVPKRRLGLITHASAPVNIIPAGELGPDVNLDGGGGTTTVEDNGETLVTNFGTTPGHSVQKRRLELINAANNPIISATAPVHIIPIDELPPGQVHTDGHSNSTDDGTTLTTTYFPASLSQRTSSDATSPLGLLNLNNQSLVKSDLDKGINCQGSIIMCVGANAKGVMHTLRDYMYAIPHGYHYYDGQQIACMKHTVYPYPWIQWGFYCAFMQGNIPAEGFDGAVIQLKMQQLIEHHCLGCGSVPFSPDNDPRTLGVLVVNYVRQSECEGLCYYVPPGEPSNSVKVPQGMTLSS